MRSFSTLVVLTATVVMNGGVEFTSAVNVKQATTFSSRTNSLEDAQLEERVFGIKLGLTNFFAKVALRKALSEADVEEEIRLLNRLRADFFYRFLYDLKAKGKAWEDVKTLPWLQLTEGAKWRISEWKTLTFDRMERYDPPDGESPLVKIIVEHSDKKTTR